MKPYRQGDLDGLCGAYAVINAVRLVCKNISAETLQAIFLKSMKLQIRQRKSVFFIVNGLNQLRIARIMQRIIKPNFDIKYSRPFKNRQKVSLPELWGSFSDYLNGNEQRCIIFSYETNAFGHWTIAQSMTAKRICLFDSDQRKIINRRHCSTTELSPETPFLIDFTATFYIEGK